VAEHCPQCDSPILVVKSGRGKGRHIACPNMKCKYTREIEE
jgi:DNA topoisomerase-1